MMTRTIVFPAKDSCLICPGRPGSAGEECGPLIVITMKDEDSRLYASQKASHTDYHHEDTTEPEPYHSPKHPKKRLKVRHSSLGNVTKL